MYSTAGGRPGGRGGGGGGGGKLQGRYVKGRLPEGVDFAAYPGRSSTPLPTAESKSAERINQLKIWNEAATNHDKRLLTPKSKESGATGRRTDSFKDARERHSASFQATNPPPPQPNATAAQRQAARNAPNADIYADRSDDDEEEEYDEYDAPAPAAAPMATTTSTGNKLPTHAQGHVPPPAPAQPAPAAYAHAPAPMAGNVGVGREDMGTSHAAVPEEYSMGHGTAPAPTTAPTGRVPKQSGGCCVLQ